MGLYLNDTTTRLAVYYRYENTTTSGDIDTAVANFVFNDGGGQATANYISRDYSGTQVLATANDNVQDPLVYIQNTPGTYATVKIPGLSGISNRVIHLAELQMEQVYDASDTLLNTPPLLFMDMYDSTASKYKTIPYSVENAYLTAANTAGTYFTISTAGYGSLGSFHFIKKTHPAPGLSNGNLILLAMCSIL